MFANAFPPGKLKPGIITIPDSEELKKGIRIIGLPYLLKGDVDNYEFAESKFDNLPVKLYNAMDAWVHDPGAGDDEVKWIFQALPKNTTLYVAGIIRKKSGDTTSTNQQSGVYIFNYNSGQTMSDYIILVHDAPEINDLVNRAILLRETDFRAATAAAAAGAGKTNNSNLISTPKPVLNILAGGSRRIRRKRRSKSLRRKSSMRLTKKRL
jgi:hypothetical protein